MPLIHSPCWTLQASSCHVVLTMWCMTVDILVCVLTVTLGICNIPSPSELDLAQPFLLLTDSTAGSVLSHCFPCQSAQPEPSGSAVTQHTGSPSTLAQAAQPFWVGEVLQVLPESESESESEPFKVIAAPLKSVQPFLLGVSTGLPSTAKLAYVGTAILALFRCSPSNAARSWPSTGGFGPCASGRRRDNWQGP